MSAFGGGLKRTLGYLQTSLEGNTVAITNYIKPRIL